MLVGAPDFAGGGGGGTTGEAVVFAGEATVAGELAVAGVAGEAPVAGDVPAAGDAVVLEPGMAAPSTWTRSLTAYAPPGLISIITIGFTASRFSLKVTAPVTPGKLFVAASASRIALPSSELARLMASNMIFAAS